MVKSNGCLVVCTSYSTPCYVRIEAKVSTLTKARTIAQSVVKKRGNITMIRVKHPFYFPSIMNKSFFEMYEMTASNI